MDWRIELVRWAFCKDDIKGMGILRSHRLILCAICSETTPFLDVKNVSISIVCIDK